MSAFRLRHLRHAMGIFFLASCQLPLLCKLLCLNRCATDKESVTRIRELLAVIAPLDATYPLTHIPAIWSRVVTARQCHQIEPQ